MPWTNLNMTINLNKVEIKVQDAPRERRQWQYGQAKLKRSSQKVTRRLFYQTYLSDGHAVTTGYHRIAVLQYIVFL